MRFITELDFYYVDFLSFIVTLVININLVSGKIPLFYLTEYPENFEAERK